MRKIIVSLAFVILISNWSLGGVIKRVHFVDMGKLMESSDLVCLGTVVKIEKTGGVDVPDDFAWNYDRFDESVLTAEFVIKHAYKGSANQKITIRCHRKMSAMMMGISDGSFIAFLKKNGELYEPACQPGYLIPINEEIFTSEKYDQSVMRDVLEYSIENGERNNIRSCLGALRQIIFKDDFIKYLVKLLKLEDEYVKGEVFLHIANRPIESKLLMDKARSFSKEKHSQREINLLAEKVSFEFLLAERKSLRDSSLNRKINGEISGSALNNKL
jgi:hypothetical protein